MESGDPDRKAAAAANWGRRPCLAGILNRCFEQWELSVRTKQPQVTRHPSARQRQQLPAPFDAPGIARIVLDGNARDGASDRQPLGLARPPGRPDVCQGHTGLDPGLNRQLVDQEHPNPQHSAATSERTGWFDCPVVAHPKLPNPVTAEGDKRVDIGLGGCRVLAKRKLT